MFILANCIIKNYIIYNYVMIPIIYNVGGFVVKTILTNILPKPVSNVLCL